jgi:hypothetical protein
MIEVEEVENGFLITQGDPASVTVVEGTNPRTVAVRLGRAIIKALKDDSGIRGGLQHE